MAVGATAARPTDAPPVTPVALSSHLVPLAYARRFRRSPTSLPDILDNLEFAKGGAESTWGSVRAAMGHPEPFPVKYVAIGNEDSGKENYHGNRLKFYNAIKEAYLDILMISNCDGSSTPLDHPADLYDFHVRYLLPDLFAFLVV
ncbi:hypothetical protein ZWY2020_006953 [Hordeum vulgare]|nr:hypothetical protein ZWY2020_006953 [Hordeum vulgare]